jgi:predicted Zn finger-like uncharacterized protein
LNLDKYEKCPHCRANFRWFLKTSDNVEMNDFLVRCPKCYGELFFLKSNSKDLSDELSNEELDDRASMFDKDF